MTQPIAGWYTDPAGDTSKLRYWDGTKWTDSLMDAPAPQPEASSVSMPTQAAEASSSPDTPTAVPAEAPASSEAQTQPTQPAQGTSAYDAAYQQPVGQPTYAEAQPAAQSTQPVAPGAPVVTQDTYAPIYVNYGDMPLYYVSPQDSTLRLVAFVIALISTICAGFVIIPLAWMIPMTVMTWQIYKGKRANTVAFGVCSLIFLDLITGILLLVSTKDQ